MEKARPPSPAIGGKPRSLCSSIGRTVFVSLTLVGLVGFSCLVVAFYTVKLRSLQERLDNLERQNVFAQNSIHQYVDQQLDKLFKEVCIYEGYYLFTFTFQPQKVHSRSDTAGYNNDIIKIIFVFNITIHHLKRHIISIEDNILQLLGLHADYLFKKFKIAVGNLRGGCWAQLLIWQLYLTVFGIRTMN